MGRRFPTAYACVLLLGLPALVHARSQSEYPPVKQTLSKAKRDAYLAAARKVWIEVDALSDARPVAACFETHIEAMTPFSIAQKKEQAEVVLRFAALQDSPDAPPDIFHVVTLSVLLFNDELIWQGSVTPNPSYQGPDASCQYADDLAGQIRAAMREARDGSPQPQEATPTPEDLIWNVKNIGDQITEVNRVFAKHVWQFTLHNASALPQVFDGEVRYLDSSGRVVDRSPVEGLQIAPFHEQVFSGQTLISIERAGAVQRISVALVRRKN